MSDLATTQWVMVLALISAVSRAGLNLIDRYQIGLKNLSILNVNLWNNLIPAALMTLAGLLLGAGREVAHCLLDWRTVAFAALVQLTAYAFSYGFRHLNVNQVTVVGKFSDLLIPIGIFWTTYDWQWKTYGFAVATTVVSLPIFLAADSRHRRSGLLTAGAFITGALVLQAGLSPLLVPSFSASHLRLAVVFTTAVIIWRAALSCIPLWRRLMQRQSHVFRPPLSAMLMLRSGLTVVTQMTFIGAVGSAVSAVAWPILNSTGFLAMLLSSLLLKDHVTGKEKWVVAAIGGLTALRFFA